MYRASFAFLRQRFLGLAPGWVALLSLFLGIRLVQAQFGILPWKADVSTGLSIVSPFERLPTSDGQTDLTATLLDDNGQPISNADIVFDTSLGTISPLIVTTNSNGQATTQFTSSQLPGSALITAHSDDYEATLTLKVETPVPDQLTLTAEDTVLKTGEQTQVSAIIQDQFSRPIVGEVIVLFGSYGTIEPTSLLSDENGQISAIFTAGEQKGTGRISGLAGSLSQTAMIQIAGEMNYKIFLPVTTR